MRSGLLTSAILILALGLPVTMAAKTINVPATSLANALTQAKNGDTIMIAAGTYSPGSSGFRVRNLNKSFALVAAVTGAVIIDGGGSGPLFDIEGLGGPGTLSFSGIVFQNGFSDNSSASGGITIDEANVKFNACTFTGNRHQASGAGGGAVQVRGASRVNFNGVTFSQNTAFNNGGALFIIEESTVRIRASEIEGNSTVVPGHTTVATGGAVFVLNSALEVFKSNFTNNSTAFVGGAIRIFGAYDAGGASLFVSNSKFEGNTALTDPDNPAPQPEAGGAIYAEDDATVVVENSEFVANQSYWGSAIAGYRPTVEIRGTRFIDNGPDDSLASFRSGLALKRPETATAGGTINLVSNDQNDNSTNFGAVNRPSASLTVTDSILRRTAAASTDVTEQGGCLFVGGDYSRQYGTGNVPQDGDAEQNRAYVVLTDVVFDNCDVETTSLGVGNGGGIFLNFVDMTVLSSIFTHCDALGEDAVGGVLRSLGDNIVRFSDTSFAGNSADRVGGAILVDSGRIEISDCHFIDNDVTPGVDEPVQRSPGSALTLRPANGLDITGFVEDSTFTGNTGMAIVEVDSFAPPYNKVVHSRNVTHNLHFADKIFKNQLVGFGGTTASELNALNIRHSDGFFDKSDGGNSRRTSAPRIGRLVAAPSDVVQHGPIGQADVSSAFLGYAWAGAANATVDATTVTQSGGVLEVTDAERYNLRVDGSIVSFDRVSEDEGCTDSVLCLDGGRFLVDATWRNFQSVNGDAFAVPFGSPDSGLFFFFEEDNWEMLVKTVDGCGFNNNYWVFVAATTNIEYDVAVFDTLSGETKSYFNPLSNPSPAITDVSALAACDFLQTGNDKSSWRHQSQAELTRSESVVKVADCDVTDTNLCLNQSRFRVEVSWKAFDGTTGSGLMVPGAPSDDSGLFFFFDEDNWEMLVKILDGCPINNNYWVFAAATTNVEYTLSVTDTDTGAVKTYFNPLGNAAAAITDTTAFATCP
jgi:hypothetical protein